MKNIIQLLVLVGAIVLDSLSCFSQTKNQEILIPFNHTHEITDINTSPDQKWLVTVADRDSYVLLWDNQKHIVVQVFPIDGQIDEIVFTPDSKQFYVISRNVFTNQININCFSLDSFKETKRTINYASNVWLNNTTENLVTFRSGSFKVFDKNAIQLYEIIIDATPVYHKIVWSNDGKKFAVLLNNFDFIISDIRTRSFSIHPIKIGSDLNADDLGWNFDFTSNELILLAPNHSYTYYANKRKIKENLVNFSLKKGTPIEEIYKLNNNEYLVLFEYNRSAKTYSTVSGLLKDVIGFQNDYQNYTYLPNYQTIIFGTTIENSHSKFFVKHIDSNIINSYILKDFILTDIIVDQEPEFVYLVGSTKIIIFDLKTGILTEATNNFERENNFSTFHYFYDNKLLLQDNQTTSPHSSIISLSNGKQQFIPEECLFSKIFPIDNYHYLIPSENSIRTVSLSDNRSTSLLETDGCYSNLSCASENILLVADQTTIYAFDKNDGAILETLVCSETIFEIYLLTDDRVIILTESGDILLTKKLLQEPNKIFHYSSTNGYFQDQCLFLSPKENTLLIIDALLSNGDPYGMIQINLQNLQITEHKGLAQFLGEEWYSLGNNILWHDEETFYTETMHYLRKYDLKTSSFTQTKIEHTSRIKVIQRYNDSLIFTGSEDKTIILWNENDLTPVKIFFGHFSGIKKIISVPQEERFMSQSEDGSLKIWSINNSEFPIATIYFVNQFDYIIYNELGYYLSSSAEATKNMWWYIDQNKSYPFEQFDIKYNRPDIILECLGYADSSLIAAYHQAYLKRLKKMNFTEEMLQDDFHLPEINIENLEEIPSIDYDDKLDLRLKLFDSKYPLDRINVWVNDVAIYGKDGISLRDTNIQELATTLSVTLAKGKNKIQVSVLNQAGTESYKETIDVECTAGKTRPDLYILTLGVSNYKDTRYNLTYASKDARDMSAAFQKNKFFANVFTKTLTDEKVILENLIDLKTFLASADINDQVIIFIAGHGVLDANFDYYFASYDMDFQNPSARGIPYEMIESLLDGIKPLKKLLFMDTCHSGEVDKDDIQVADNNTASENDITFRNVGLAVENKENQLGLQNTSELMKSLFTDLRKGTGATVISSAGGVEFAMESDAWQNGLFTYCLINGLTNKKADLNSDNQVMVSELQIYIQNEVNKLSNGKQTPTSRIENTELDYRIW
jgi:WD40 repeat protein